MWTFRPRIAISSRWTTWPLSIHRLGQHRIHRFGNLDPTKLPPLIEEYQVGWVCALPKELTAARAMLDEEHEPFKSDNVRDNNSCVLSRVGEHYVVMACLPAGVYGTFALFIALFIATLVAALVATPPAVAPITISALIKSWRSWSLPALW